MRLYPIKGSIVNFIAGLLILASILLAVFVNLNWLYFTGFIGLMLVISSLTGFCPMALILKSLGLKEAQCSLKNN